MLAGALAVVVGAVLGLSLAAPPGPMNAVIAEESVIRGWRSGFTAGLGAMSADAIFFVLAYLGVVAVLQRLPTLQSTMVGFGGLLMLYFAYGTVQDASATFRADGDAGKGFRKAFVLALTNPFQILWWLTAGVGMLEATTVEVFGRTLTTTGGPLTVAGFFGGIVVWIVGFPAALVLAGERLDSFATGVAYVSALVLALFGVLFLYRAVGPVVPV
ncbi:LysE family translocator [Halobacteriaceae archaeon GCM10025711]